MEKNSIDTKISVEVKKSRKKIPVWGIGLLIVAIGLAGWFIYTKYFVSSTVKIQYQTEVAAKGTLVTSITGTGQVSSANNAQVTTQASGVVKKIMVKNSQMVKAGDPVLEIDLDLEGQQRSSQAYASYQSAKNSLDSSRANMYTAQADLLTKWDKYKTLAETGTYQNGDGSPKADQRTLPAYMTVNDEWLASEAKYKIQESSILQSQTSLNTAWLSYQQSSPIVYAPISGVVTGLSLQVGSVLVAQSGSSGNATAQKIASIKTNAPPTISVALTEIDIPKVKVGNKATVVFDAYAEKTYTGEIISIDTIGAISSGVTNYPAVIKLDTEAEEILSNMNAQVTITTNMKDNVLIIPASSVKTANGESIVQVMKNGKPTDVVVQVGLTSATQAEIIGGVAEGDTVVTSTINTGMSTSSSTQSIFSTMGGGSRNTGSAIQRVAH